MKTYPTDKYTLKLYYYPMFNCNSYEHLTREEVVKLYHHIVDREHYAIYIKIYNCNLDICVYEHDESPHTHYSHKDTFVRATEPRTVNGVTYYPVDREEEE